MNESNFLISATHVGAIIEIARQLAVKFMESEGDFDWSATPVEDELIDLVTSFQQIRDGYRSHNALEDPATWKEFLSDLRKIDTDEFYA